MEKEIINNIINSLNQSLEDKGTHIEFNDDRYDPTNIDKNNFHEIKNTESIKKIAFIDGGNTEIIKTVSFSLHFIRIYCSIWQNNKKISSKKYESYILVNARKQDNKINFEANIYGDINIDKNDLVFDSFDETIRQGINRANISRIGEIARHFAELKIAENIIENLEPGDVIIRDGSLQSSITNESKYFNNLYKKALEKNIIICGLSKTNTLITETGYPVSALLEELTPKSSFYYHPVVEINNPVHKAELFFLKLHKSSKHIFRFEVFKENKFDKEELFSLLKENSKDPVFIGYPYGLIEADRFARVSNREAEYLKTLIISKAGSNLQKYFSSVNAHDILDKIS